MHESRKLLLGEVHTKIKKSNTLYEWGSLKESKKQNIHNRGGKRPRMLARNNKAAVVGGSPKHVTCSKNTHDLIERNEKGELGKPPWVLGAKKHRGPRPP